MAESKEPKFYRLLRYAIIGLLYAALITPLLLSAKFFFPFISTKTFYFRFVVELAAALYLIYAFAVPQARPIWRSWVSRAVVAYLSVMIVASIFGVNWYRSFWGNIERGEGLLTFFHIVAYALIATGILRTRVAWRRFLLGVVGVSLASALYATLQKMGVPWVMAASEVRVSGLIGNAAFFAGYLLVNAFLAVWLGLQYPSSWKRYLLWAVAVYEIIMLNLTETRGALLGLAAGLLFIAGYAIVESSSRKTRIAAAAAMLALLVFGFGIWAARDSSLIKSIGSLNRLAHISREDITTQSRLLGWQAAAKGIGDRWVLGYGYENFNVAYNRYFPAAVFRDSGSQIWFDRAHSIVFDVAAAGGALGLLAYFGIFAAAGRALYRYHHRRPEDRWTAPLMGAMLLAYFVQNLFVFDTLGTYIIFYLVLAFLSRLETDSLNQPGIRMHYASLNAPLGIAVAGGLVLAVTFAVILPARANMQVMQALIVAGRDQNMEATIDAYRSVFAYKTYVDEEARQKFSEAALGFRGNARYSEEQKHQMFRDAIEQMKIALKLSPLDARNYLYLMTLYNNLPLPQAGSFEEVIRLGHNALKLSPTRPQIFFEMGQAAAALGRFDESIGYFRRAVELNPQPIESHWNLALAYFVSGRDTEGEAVMDYIYSHGGIGVISEGNVRNAIQVHIKAGRYEAVIPMYQDLLVRTPGNAQMHAELALVYGQLCRISEARAALDEAVVLSPDSAAEAKRLMDGINAKCQL